jgi:hypothetical protein
MWPATQWKKTIGSPDSFPFTPILEKFTLNVLAKPPKETYLMEQIPIVVVRKYGTSIIISPLVVNIKMFFGGGKDALCGRGDFSNRDEIISCRSQADLSSIS